MKQITKSLFLVLLLLATYSLIGQHSKFPTLEERVNTSTFVIEGEVIEKETYYDSEKDQICTANKVKIYKQFKGEFSNDYFTIITKGGKYGDLIQYTTHSFQLGLNDFGIFFLTDNNYYTHDLGNYPQKIFQGHPHYGFLGYYSSEKNKKLYAYDIYQKYDNLERDLLQKIEATTGQGRIVKSLTPRENEINDLVKELNNNSIETIVEYTIENPSLTGALNEYLEFDLNLSSLLTSEEFFSGEILVNYNSLTFGTNLAASGILTITKGTVILAPNYTLTVNDVSPSQLKISVTSTSNNPNTLYLINNSSEQLVHLKIDLSNLSGNTGINFDEINMQGVSEFFDISTNIVEPFDFVRANDKLVMDVSAFMTPQIYSVHPPVVRGGIDTLYIRGINFGDTLTPLSSRVEFENADEASGWMKPFSRDYVFWSDTLIMVKVPAVGSGVPSNVSGQVRNYAGTGDIKVLRQGQYSQTKHIDVKFSVRSFQTGFLPSFPQVLVNRNGIGGYTLSYDPNFLTFPNSSSGGTATPIEMFEKALVMWRCSTGVNFIVNDSIPNLPLENPSSNNANKMVVSFEPIPVPGQTDILIRELCDTNYINQSSARWYVEKFRIRFNSNTTWWIDEDTTNVTISPPFEDLQSVALHEIGHGHLLNHTMNFNFGGGETMYWTPTSQFLRFIDVNNLEGGRYIIDSLSTLQTNSCLTPMKKVNLHCEVITNTDEVIYKPLILSVYPNPIDNFINLDFDEIPTQSVEIFIYDALGREIQVNQHRPTINIQVNTSNLTEGIYFVKIKVGKASYTHKVIKL